MTETYSNEEEDDEDGGLIDDPENSVRFDLDIGLEPKFNDLVDSMTNETFIHYSLIRPRPSSVSQVRTTINCLLANLIRAYVRDPTWYVAIPFRTRDYTSSRYRNRGIGYDNLRRVIGYLLGRSEPHITFVEGINSRQVTRIRGTAPLIALLGEGNEQNDSSLTNPEAINPTNHPNHNPSPTTGRISLCHQSIVHTGSGDCIRLKGPKVKDPERPEVPAKAPLIGYEDSVETRGMRANLTTWNTFIRSHLLDMFVTDDDFEQIFDKKKRKIDLTRTRLHRVFNNASFDQGGRCYGGWWQGVPKKWRPYMTIDNSPTRELDYSNLHPAILYARKGLPLPTDAYVIEGIDPSFRGLIKETFNALLNAPDRRISGPTPWEQKENPLPEGWTFRRILQAVVESHAPIADYFYTGIGLKLQRLDSDVAADVMAEMMWRGKPVLPVHDSFIVYRAYFDVLRDVMLDTYKRRTHTTKTA
jgi:hypothetical protein